MENIIREVENLFIPTTKYPSFKAGDSVTVSYKIREGSKERLQEYTGIVIQLKGAGRNVTFTVRKISGGVGVERIFPFSSPFINSIVVEKHGSVRRARIYYIRKLTGKASRIQEKNPQVKEKKVKEIPELVA